MKQVALFLVMFFLLVSFPPANTYGNSEDEINITDYDNEPVKIRKPAKKAPMAKKQQTQTGSKINYGSGKYTILMHNGGRVEAANYVIEGENINVLLQNPQGSTILIPRSDIHKIVKNEEAAVKETPEEKKWGICDTVSCTSTIYDCCKKLSSYTEIMKSNCAKAEKNPKDNYYESDCTLYKKRVKFLEEQCPNCSIIISCCGWLF